MNRPLVRIWLVIGVAHLGLAIVLWLIMGAEMRDIAPMRVIASIGALAVFFGLPYAAHCLGFDGWSNKMQGTAVVVWFLLSGLAFNMGLQALH